MQLKIFVADLFTSSVFYRSQNKQNESDQQQSEIIAETSAPPGDSHFLCFYDPSEKSLILPCFEILNFSHWHRLTFVQKELCAALDFRNIFFALVLHSLHHISFFPYYFQYRRSRNRNWYEKKSPEMERESTERFLQKFSVFHSGQTGQDQKAAVRFIYQRISLRFQWSSQLLSDSDNRLLLYLWSLWRYVPYRQFRIP